MENVIVSEGTREKLMLSDEVARNEGGVKLRRLLRNSQKLLQPLLLIASNVYSHNSALFTNETISGY